MVSKLNNASQIAAVQSDEDFHLQAGRVFDFQYANNAVFRKFIEGINRSPIYNPNLPIFLPIELFKHGIVNTMDTAELVFKSSGTTGGPRSVHHVFSASLYVDLSMQHFKSLYGSLADYTIIALLPSYQSTGDSSLVFMVENFMKDAAIDSEFLLHEPAKTWLLLTKLKEDKRKTLLIGVSYALLDFAEEYTIDFPELVVMETGGMKGRRIELTRKDLHQQLQKGFPKSAIHSEYGMTELLSQGYMIDGETFTPPRWMRAYTTDVSDPLQLLPVGQRGLLAFIDLANVYSCAFIQTKDVGTVLPNGNFTVEGRLDNSDLRGCNLLYT